MLETMVEKKFITNDVFVRLLTLIVPIGDEDRKLTQVLFLHLIAVP